MRRPPGATLEMSLTGTGMVRTLRIVLVLFASTLGWWLLENWVAGPAERAYLLLPLTALGLFVAVHPKSWKPLRAQARPAVVFLLGLLAFAALLGLSLTGNGFALPLLSEILITTYFLVGVTIVVLATQRLFHVVFTRLANRLWGPSPKALSAKVVRLLVSDALPLALVFLACLPYLMALAYIHRFKVPNTSTPRDIGRAYEDVEFVSADGLRLRGWFVPARRSPSQRTIIVCHGLGANRSHFLGCVKVADTLAANVLLFDFRGHGDSDGHTVTMGYREKDDVLAAIAYLRQRRPEQARQVIGLGVSMGASALLGAAAVTEPPLDAIIVDSGFAVAVDVTDNVLGAVPGALRPWLKTAGVPLASLHAGCSLDEVRPVDHIAAVRAPVLIIHCEEDRLIPLEHAHRLYRAAREPKSLLTACTGGHCGMLYGAEAAYLQAAVRLLSGESKERK